MWNDVWILISTQFSEAFRIFFVEFTPTGQAISIGATILGFTILHKIIDILVPFAGGSIYEQSKPEKPTQEERNQNNYWMFRGG